MWSNSIFKFIYRYLLHLLKKIIYYHCLTGLLFIYFQMNSVLTKTDTSLWPMRWIPHSLNWLDINLLDLATFSNEFTYYEVNNYPKNFSNNITIINSINKSKEYYNKLSLLDYLLFEPVRYIYILIIYTCLTCEHH